MAIAPERVNAMLAGAGDARPYGHNGMMPKDAVVTVYSPHGNKEARRYVSDVPYDEAYNDRTVCEGTRKDGEPCQAKAEAGEHYCRYHDPSK